MNFEQLADDLIGTCCTWLDAADLHTISRVSRKIRQILAKPSVITSICNIVSTDLTNCCIDKGDSKFLKKLPKWMSLFPLVKRMTFSTKETLRLDLNYFSDSFSLNFMPPYLTTLDFGREILLGGNVVRYLPQSLTFLKCQSHVSTLSAKELPRSLRHLEGLLLMSLPTVREDYPSQLTFLEIKLICGLKNRHLSCLPVNLLHFKINNNPCGGKVTSDGLQHLPGSLTSLSLNTCLGENVVSSFPRALRHLSFYMNNATIVDMSFLPPRLTSLNMSSSSFLLPPQQDTVPFNFPSSLIRLDIQGVNNGGCLWLIHSLPNNLQYLAVDDLPASDHCPLMPNLTHLVVNGYHHRSFPTLNDGTFRRLPQLQIFEMGWFGITHDDVITQIPRQLTQIKLSCNQTSQLRAKQIFEGSLFPKSSSEMVIIMPIHCDAPRTNSF
jgi:hypothetical protein